MSTGLVGEYMRWLESLLEARARDASIAEESSYLDELDEIWEQMNQAQQDEARALTKARGQQTTDQQQGAK